MKKNTNRFLPLSARVTEVSLILVLIFCGVANAQQEGAEPNELDKMYVPDKNSLFNSDSKVSSDEGGYEAAEIKNTLSINPTLFCRGTAALFYERWLGERFSITGGLGVNFTQDYIYNFAHEVGYGTTGLINDPRSTVSLEKIMSKGIYSGLGDYFLFSLKWHYSDLYAGDWNSYFELNTQLSTMTFNLHSTSSPLIWDDPVVDVQTFSVNAIFGSRYITTGKIKTSHGLFLGLGAKAGNYEVFVTEERRISDPQHPGSFYTKEGQKKSSLRESVWGPSILLGYIFGIGF